MKVLLPTSQLFALFDTLLRMCILNIRDCSIDQCFHWLSFYLSLKTKLSLTISSKLNIDANKIKAHFWLCINMLHTEREHMLTVNVYTKQCRQFIYLLSRFCIIFINKTKQLYFQGLNSIWLSHLTNIIPLLMSVHIKFTTFRKRYFVSNVCFINRVIITWISPSHSDLHVCLFWYEWYEPFH